MERFIRRGTAATLVFIIPTLFAGGSFAWDGDFHHNRLLRGEYAVTEFRSCVQTVEGGFTQDFRLLANGNFRTSVLQQVRTYNGDGTGNLTGMTTNMFLATGPGQLVGSQSEVTCSIDYRVNPDLSYIETLQCSGTDLSTGNTFTITPSTRTGQIAPGRNNLVYNLTDPQIQLLTFFPPGVDPKNPDMEQVLFSRERVCIRSGKGVKIKGLRGGSDDRD